MCFCTDLEWIFSPLVIFVILSVGQGRLLLQMRLKSSWRQLKTYCQKHMPKIASKLQSLLWELGQIFKKSLAEGERLNLTPGFIRCASLTEHPSKKNLFMKFYLIKYLSSLNCFISPEKFDSLFWNISWQPYH